MDGPGQDYGIQRMSTRPPFDASPRAQAALALGALGIVFGDIGTSPLYSFREALGQAGGVSADAAMGSWGGMGGDEDEDGGVAGPPLNRLNSRGRGAFVRGRGGEGEGAGWAVAGGGNREGIGGGSHLDKYGVEASFLV